MNTISQFLQNPATALVVALALGAVALSGHFSITATQCLLFAAWVVAVFSLWAQPWPVLIGFASIMAGALVLLGYWFRPDVVPAYSGILSPQSTLLFSPDGGKITKIQIGQSRVFIVDPNNPLAAQLYPALRTAQFRVVTGKAGTNKRRVFKHCIAGTCSQHPKRDWRTKHKRTRRHCEPSRLVKRAAKWVGSGRNPRRRLVVCVGSRFLLHHLT